MLLSEKKYDDDDDVATPSLATNEILCHQYLNINNSCDK